MIFHKHQQGTEEWLRARRGVITASRFRDALDKLKSGAPSKAAIAYAQDVARERIGGAVPPKFQNAAMRTGQIEEPVARVMREMETGDLIEEAGFITTDDGLFGVSVDGLIGTHGVWECKTMVSSETLFTAMVDGDISDYVDQCNGAMWLLGRRWVDLSLWCPDLQKLHTVRIERNDDTIDRLEAGLMEFARTVSGYEARLRALLAPATTPPWTEAKAPTTPAAPRAAALAPTF